MALLSTTIDNISEREVKEKLTRLVAGLVPTRRHYRADQAPCLATDLASDCARKSRGLRGGRSRTTETQQMDPAGERPDRSKPSQRAGSESCVRRGNPNAKRRQRVNGLCD